MRIALLLEGDKSDVEMFKDTIYSLNGVDPYDDVKLTTVEDHEPAEPLIKDKTIRKAVRAWAEMNGIRFIHMCSRTRKENARIVGQNALGRTFTMEIDNEYEIRVCFKDYKECYTVAELCGEEEE